MKRTTTAPKPKPGASRGKGASLHLRRILVPLDFSEDSLKALRYALRLAGQFRARITLAHVVEPMIYPPDTGFVPLDQVRMVQASKKRLVALAREEVPSKFLDKSVVVSGSPAHEIATLAQRQKADLIIVSTHGYTGLRHVL